MAQGICAAIGNNDHTKSERHGTQLRTWIFLQFLFNCAVRLRWFATVFNCRKATFTLTVDVRWFAQDERAQSQVLVRNEHDTFVDCWMVKFFGRFLIELKSHFHIHGMPFDCVDNIECKHWQRRCGRVAALLAALNSNASGFAAGKEVNSFIEYGPVSTGSSCCEQIMQISSFSNWAGCERSHNRWWIWCTRRPMLCYRTSVSVAGSYLCCWFFGDELSV